MATHVEIEDASGGASGVRYLRDGRERVQRAAAVAVACYSIETPRLLLRSTSARGTRTASATTRARSAGT
jgi:choline dehydrogenase-like flavoprotein